MPGVIVSYKGTAISNLIAPASKTLQTSGKYCEGNITVDYTDPDIELRPVKDGKTRLYLSIPTQCDLTKLTIPLYWNQDISNGVIIDWGDGSATETVSGTGNVHATPHNYATGGSYIVTMSRPTGTTTTIMLGNGSGSTGLLGTTDAGSSTYRNVLSAIETGDGVTALRNYCFQRNTGLKNVILGPALTTIGSYAFNYDYGIASIHFLGTLPANGDISNASTWNNVPVWCKIYVPSQYFNGDQVQNIPSRMPSTSTYTYAIEPYADVQESA